jgi:hypothetical protein
MKLSRISENCRRYSEIEAVSSDIYNLALDKIKPSGSDFKTKIQAQN